LRMVHQQREASRRVLDVCHWCDGEVVTCNTTQKVNSSHDNIKNSIAWRQESKTNVMIEY
jgi:hypothetical protein